MGLDRRYIIVFARLGLWTRKTRFALDDRVVIGRRGRLGGGAARGILTRHRGWLAGLASLNWSPSPLEIGFPRRSIPLSFGSSPSGDFREQGFV